jgi:6-phosphogluconate dehydrogenase
MIGVIYVMGVSGSGKSLIGTMLAEEFKIPFFDGDDFHPQANIDKMKNGIPLNDEDRADWLLKLNEVAKEHQSQGCVISSSALKEKYRVMLMQGLTAKCSWVHLAGSYDTISARMQDREHFMPPALLQSQFDALEAPKYAIEISILENPKSIINTIKNKLTMKEFGVVGMGVMGKSISRNLASRGFALSLFNRHVDQVEVDVAKKFVAQYPELSMCTGYDDITAFVKSLALPRKIFFMVEAGKAIDELINVFLPHLEPGDIIIDGGNSHYKDTKRRIEYTASHGISFVGSGVSGGEEGALKGPAIMPGGAPEAYQHIKPYLEAIAAKDDDGLPCCTYIGPEGAGHFVKMVHNGIEYAEMQLIAEVYEILRFGKGTNTEEIGEIFGRWNQSTNASFLLEISSKILSVKKDGSPIVDHILDAAGSKGTGSWTTITGAELGVPITMIDAALNARYLSSLYTERQALNKLYNHAISPTMAATPDDIEASLYLARIINHHQGFKLIQEGAKSFGWTIDMPNLSRIWTNGCIIRSSLMKSCKTLLTQNSEILYAPTIKETINSHKPALIKTVAAALEAGVDIPCMTAALTYLNGITLAQSNANIIQAQRDFFGAHRFKLKSDPQGSSVHHDWN